MMLTPDSPWRISLIEFIQPLLVFERVHTLPEPVILVGHEEPILDQSREWLPNEFFTGANIIEYFPPHYEEASVNPNICGGQRTNLPYSPLSLGLY